MKKLMRCFWITVLAAAVVSLPSLTVRARAAQVTKPVAVLSIASVDHLMDDMAYLTKVSGRPDVGGFIQLMSASFVEHLDRTKPAGVLITMVDDELKGVGFLPVPDLEKVLAIIKDRFAVEVDDLGNGIKKLEVGDGVYLKQHGAWLYFSDHHRHLKDFPEDPVAMLDGLDKQYGIALRLFIQNIPQGLRDVRLFQIQSMIDQELDPRRVDDPDVDAEFLKSISSGLNSYLAMLVNESNTVTLGWAVDRQGERTYVDFNFTALDGSSLSKHLGRLTRSRSTFTGFLMNDAAATFHAAMRVSDVGGDQIDAFIRLLRTKAMKGIDSDPSAPEALKEIVNSVLDVLDKTIKEGQTDVGATVVLGPKTFKFVGGVQVADGRALAEAFQKLIELARGQPDVPEVKFYAAKHKDIDLHTLTVPISEADVDWRSVLGEELDVVIGTGPDSLFLALGEGGDDLLKSVVDQSLENGQREVAPIHFHVALKPLMSFLASIYKDNAKWGVLAGTIDQSRGSDGILLTVEPIENGIGFRLQLEQGVLEVLGEASRN